jgi:hypothetical protein
MYYYYYYYYHYYVITAAAMSLLPPGVCDVDAVDVWGLGCPAPYVMACIYAVICMLLLNVQVILCAI